MHVRRSKEIRAQITRQMDLWERDLHAGLVVDTEAEGAVREGKATSGGEEEDEAVARSYHNTLLSGNLRQVIHVGGNAPPLTQRKTRTSRDSP